MAPAILQAAARLLRDGAGRAGHAGLRSDKMTVFATGGPGRGAGRHQRWELSAGIERGDEPLGGPCPGHRGRGHDRLRAQPRVRGRRGASVRRRGSRVTALEYLLGALGGDLVGGFRALARKRRLEIDEVEATVDATLDNPLTHLGVVGEEGHPGLERVAMRVHVATLEPEDAVREVWDEAVRRSPLMRTLGGAARIEVVMTVTV